MLLSPEVYRYSMSTEPREMISAEVNTYSQEFWLRETVSLLALSTMPGLGYWTLRNLSQTGYTFNEVLKHPSTFEEFGTYISKASSNLPRGLSGDWSEIQKTLWTQGNELYRRLVKEGVTVIHIKQPGFPESLRQIPDPPQWLFVQGNLSVLYQPSLAIVGTRHPSEDGLFLAKYIGACIPSFGAVTVSGLANGIDQIIHKNSIRFQTPTVAVLGNGIFKNYPAGSEALRHDICVKGGVVITEYLPDQTYSAENFVRRNRLQAGLANVLIPVEWKSQSGTAHTVRYAHESGKKIVCLQMPDWQEKDHSELVLAREKGAKLFTIPEQGNHLLDYVRLQVFGNSSSNLVNREKQTEQKVEINKETQRGLGNHNFNKEQLQNKSYIHQLELFD